MLMRKGWKLYLAFAGEVKSFLKSNSQTGERRASLYLREWLVIMLFLGLVASLVILAFLSGRDL